METATTKQEHVRLRAIRARSDHDKYSSRGPLWAPLSWAMKVRKEYWRLRFRPYYREMCNSTVIKPTRSGRLARART